MKTTIKKTLAIVLALALTLVAIGCSVAYADTFRGEVKKSPVTVENTPSVTTDIPAAPQTPTAAAPDVSAPAPSAPAANQLIGRDKAEALARESLGLSDLHLSGIELDDGRYELDFCDGNTEYDVDVHATSGTILKSVVDHYDECDRCDKDWDDRYDDWDDRYDDWDDRYDDWDDRYDD